MPNDNEMITGLTGSAAPTQLPQFATAEYASTPGVDRCRICNSAISGEYFRINSQMACGKCAAEAREGQPTDSHAAFTRALLLGLGAAFIGLVIYSTFAIATGMTIGYLALAVGWLVAKGMMKGSHGVGGRRYQLTAVLLTYAAISLSSIPIWISFAVKGAKAHHQVQATASTPSSTDNAQAAIQNSATEQPAGSEQAAPHKKMNLAKALGTLAFLGLASPFLELASPGSGVLGLIILFVGLSIAFRMTAAKPLNVDGPYSVTG